MTEITPRPQDANHARLMQIVSDLEQELQKVPAPPLNWHKSSAMISPVSKAI